MAERFSHASMVKNCACTLLLEITRGLEGCHQLRAMKGEISYVAGLPGQPVAFVEEIALQKKKSGTELATINCNVCMLVCLTKRKFHENVRFVLSFFDKNRRSSLQGFSRISSTAWSVCAALKVRSMNVGEVSRLTESVNTCHCLHKHDRYPKLFTPLNQEERDVPPKNQLSFYVWNAARNVFF